MKKPLRSWQTGIRLLHLPRWSQLPELLEIQRMIVNKKQEILIHRVLCRDLWFHLVLNDLKQPTFSLWVSKNFIQELYYLPHCKSED